VYGKLPGQRKTLYSKQTNVHSDIEDLPQLKSIHLQLPNLNRSSPIKFPQTIPIIRLVAHNYRLSVRENCVIVRMPKSPMRNPLRAFPTRKLLDCITTKTIPTLTVLEAWMRFLRERKGEVGSCSDASIRSVSIRSTRCFFCDRGQGVLKPLQIPLVLGVMLRYCPVSYAS
jgi:hypothetical protein